MEVKSMTSTGNRNYSAGADAASLCLRFASRLSLSILSFSSSERILGWWSESAASAASSFYSREFDSTQLSKQCQG